MTHSVNKKQSEVTVITTDCIKHQEKFSDQLDVNSVSHKCYNLYINHKIRGNLFPSLTSLGVAYD
jgi:hypothetical protein